MFLVLHLCFLQSHWTALLRLATVAIATSLYATGTLLTVLVSSLHATYPMLMIFDTACHGSDVAGLLGCSLAFKVSLQLLSVFGSGINAFEKS